MPSGPSSASWSRPGSRRRSARRDAGHPAGRRPWSARTRTERWCSPWRSRSNSLAVALVGLGGTVFALNRADRARGHLSVDAIAADLADLAAAIRLRRPEHGPLLGIGVSMVGVVRRSDGFVALAPNLGWRDVPLGERLAGVLPDAVPISVDNDADLGALAELRRGVAAGVDDLVFISGEVGVGGGLIVDGRPLRGSAGFGGEVGHIPFNPDGIACGCGSIGCWETEVGERALLQRAGHPADGGRAEVDAVLREAAAGSAPALEALDHVGRWLGLGLAGLVNVLNPRLIVLGGLFGRISGFVMEPLVAELDRRALPAARALVRIVPTRVGVDAPLLGAAELAFEPLLADPSAWLGVRDGRPQPVSA